MRRGRAGLGGPVDVSSFWIEVPPHDIGLFCNPFQQLCHKRWHEVYWHGHWNVEEMLRQHGESLMHSSGKMPEKGELWPRDYGINFIFKTNDVLVVGDLDYEHEGTLAFWGETLERARAECNAWREKFLKKPKRKREPACFRVLSITLEGVKAEPIPLERRFPQTEVDLALHYGDDFPEWKAQFIRELKSHVSGASIFEGEPGTGKTTFIRHLIHQLRRTHRFYYLPADQLDMLTAPNLVQFWIRESHNAKNKTKVIVVEDAEPLLMARGRDNHDQLSNFLNIADGLPGEFLKLHLICTINCKIDKLDPAVTRTGRLIAYRNFRRLSQREAQRLALAKRLAIPIQDTYSLAEIYNEQRSGFEEAETKRVGFG